MASSLIRTVFCIAALLTVAASGSIEYNVSYNITTSPSTSSGSPDTNANNAKTLSIGVAMGGLVVQAFASLAA
eukprot:CAMPEP_0169257954 /NCGR_PEP_ID=MMETSP1016-20121227/41154_1 /TAXON_ID=342587 /ORGANISM="Karlodinium micrum, Strain CCMP2283" /LENGTH=72 /DNA_ID=CAMNT_0009339857 /DNA_START=58 /DNA_END=276 /DNA_ORIENTATION=+